MEIYRDRAASKRNQVVQWHPQGNAQPRQCLLASACGIGAAVIKGMRARRNVAKVMMATILDKALIFETGRDWGKRGV
jgi:hypothetical protein